MFEIDKSLRFFSKDNRHNGWIIYGLIDMMCDISKMSDNIKHFELVSNNFGKESLIDYVPGGNQPIESYDLSNLTSENFVYREYALWNENTRVKFFQPTNKNYVSHSVTNIQRNYDVVL